MSHLVEAPEPRPVRPPGWKKWAKRVLLGAAGVTASTLLCGTAFFRIGFRDGLTLTPRFTLGDWVSDLPSHLPWVAAFAVLTAAILPLRALQWRFTLGDRAPSFGPRYHAIAIGAFFHNAAPGKMGELVRAFVLARRLKLAFFESLGSVLLCKLLELLALLTVVGIAFAGPLGNRLAGELGTALALAAGLAAFLVTLAMLGARHALPVAAWLETRGRLPRLGKALRNLGCGLSATRDPRRVLTAFLAAFGPVLASVAGFGIALHSLGVENGLFAGGVVLGAVSLGQLAPGLPVGTGMYYLTTSWSARALGATPSQAAAFAALTHLTSLSTQILVGLVSVLTHRIRPRELLRERAALAAQEAAAPQAEPMLRASGT